MAAELHWFPVFAEKWLASAAVSMMLPEQEGAYFRLLVHAWGDGSLEPRVPDDPTTLAQMSRLGARWKKLGALVRDQFDSRDGYLYNAKLSEVWNDQQQKHAKVVERGKKGGATKAAKAKHGSSSTTSTATAQRVAGTVAEGLATKNIDSPVSEPYGSERQEQAADAPAPEGARTPPTGDYLDRPSVREELAKRTHIAPRGPHDPPTPLAEAEAEVRQWDDRYTEAMAAACEKWLADNPEEATSLEQQERRRIFPNPHIELQTLGLEHLRGAMHRALVVKLKWPSKDVWISRQKQKGAA
jgi:uncharacterized protein YdaU (DUF1376 family)